MSDPSLSESKPAIPEEFREAVQYFEPQQGMRAMMRGKWCVLVPSCVDDKLVGLQEHSSHGLMRDAVEAYDITDPATHGCMQAQIWQHPLLGRLTVLRDDVGALVRVLLKESLYALTGLDEDLVVEVSRDCLGLALVEIRKILEAKAAKLATYQHIKAETKKEADISG